MKIDAETLKKQVILHLPYILFLLVFAKLGEAVRLAPGAGARSRRFPKAVRTVRRLCPCVSEYVAGSGNGLADWFMRCSHYAAGSLS